MSRKIVKKSWSSEDIACLTLGYNLGATIKTLSIVLNRSESALNKALSRLGIRQYGIKARILKLKRKGSLRVTPEKLRLEINNYFCADNTLLECNVSENISAGQINNDEISHFCGPPDQPLSPLKRRKFPALLWSNIDYALAILQNRGHTIYRLVKDYSNFKDSEICFCLDGKLKTAAQILVQENQIRAISGLEPFYIEAITEH